MFGFNQKHNIVFEKQHIIKKELCLFLIYKGFVAQRFKS
ncbi:hypothetical protein J558_2914 [Acinetobacter baumannii 1106579]|nr:hypothetical protein J558_2914 [Acinetobacter baumannii 1106579]EXE73026.1 hypothetical protein J583_3284 [Acinetobacter baumannii 83444]